MTGSFCIAVDLGGTNLRCALVAGDGRLLARESRPTELARGGDPFVAELLGLVGQVGELARGAGVRPCCIALALPGVISRDGTILESVNLHPLEGVNLAAAVASASGLPAVAVNDANACAVAEHRFGAGRGCGSLLVVTIGTGIGSGLILDGALWRGSDGSAGEFGHLPVHPSGERCRCGGTGCLELYASGRALAARARERGLAASAAELAVRAREGEGEAAAIFAEAGRSLGLAAATVVNLLNLEAIVLGGGVAASFDLIEPPMRAELASRALAVPGRRVRILRGELGDDAGLIGAAVMAFDAIALYDGAGSTVIARPDIVSGAR